MVVVYPEIALAFHRERHTGMLRKRSVHLNVRVMSLSEGSCHYGHAYMVEETDTSGDTDILLISRAGLAVQVH